MSSTRLLDFLTTQLLLRSPRPSTRKAIGQAALLATLLNGLMEFTHESRNLGIAFLNEPLHPIQIGTAPLATRPTGPTVTAGTPPIRPSHGGTAIDPVSNSKVYPSQS